ncbi:family 1 encapsulin nanocompartment shell protein [Kribbella soli]|uniref:Type 1 encapsulin shell protein n=1 Tax=Kribbella soli TaxID=1124743 RepID=A0A4R0GZ99_9ACTN|nr:family 1 encapsulin nanocompartment shell protein [Kribbella soli]TCC02623.1 bacteriocin [Kribbella soli]
MTNNLHRELAPVSDAAWGEIEEEARRTFTRDIAGRRVVDLVGPAGPGLSSVGTGHTESVEAPGEGVIALRRLSQPIIELRVPFTVSRQAVDDVERGAKDSDWQPVKDAAKQVAFAEDHLVFHGSDAAGILGVAPSTSNPVLTLPSEPRELPDTVAQALRALRLAGVNGPYSLLLSADAYTAVAETTDHGYPIRDHLARLIGDGEIIWAPALEGALLVSTRGGDYELHLGQDLSIGYLSHDAESVQLYLQESLTFLALTAESSVVLRP